MYDVRNTSASTAIALVLVLLGQGRVAAFTCETVVPPPCPPFCGEKDAGSPCTELDRCTFPDGCHPFAVERDQSGRGWLWVGSNACTEGAEDRLTAIREPMGGTLDCTPVFSCDVGDPNPAYRPGFTTVDGLASREDGSLLVVDWGGDGLAFDDTIRLFDVDGGGCECVMEWVLDDSGQEGGLDHCDPFDGHDCAPISGPFPLSGIEDVDVLADDGQTVTVNLVEDFTATFWEIDLHLDGNGCDDDAPEYAPASWSFVDATITETPMSSIDLPRGTGERDVYSADFTAFGRLWRRDAGLVTQESCLSPQEIQGGVAEVRDGSVALGGCSGDLILAEGTSTFLQSSLSLECGGLSACPNGTFVYRADAENRSGEIVRLVVRVSGDGVPGNPQIFAEAFGDGEDLVVVRELQTGPSPSVCPTTVSVEASLETATGESVATDSCAVSFVELTP